MALNFNDPACGFYQREVVDFLNEKILQNGVSPYFYLVHMGESWGDVEKKLGDILANPTISRDIKEACTWSTLALAVRFAERQKQEDKEKVKKLQDQLEEQKLLTDALMGTVSRLRGIQERQKENTQSQLQQSLTILHGVEKEQDLLRSELLRVLSTQSQKQAKTQEKKKKNEAQTSGMLTQAGTASYCMKEEVGKGSDQETAAAPGTTAVGDETNEDNMVSLSGNDTEVATFSCPQVLGAGDQAGQLLPVNLSQSSYSSLPTFSLPGAAAEAAAVPPVKNSRMGWKGKNHTRKFLTERFKQYPSFSHFADRSIWCRTGDWNCAQCHMINYSWRKMCFKCKKSRYTRQSRCSAPN